MYVAKLAGKANLFAALLQPMVANSLEFAVLDLRQRNQKHVTGNVSVANSITESNQFQTQLMESNSNQYSVKMSEPQLPALNYVILRNHIPRAQVKSSSGKVKQEPLSTDNPR